MSELVAPSQEQQKELTRSMESYVAFFEREKQQRQEELLQLKTTKYGSKKRLLDLFFSRYSDKYLEIVNEPKAGKSSRNDEEYAPNLCSDNDNNNNNENDEFNEDANYDCDNDIDELVRTSSLSLQNRSVMSELRNAEVRELSHLQRVATLLQSNFRDNLENVIRHNPNPSTIARRRSAPVIPPAPPLTIIEQNQDLWHPHLQTNREDEENENVPVSIIQNSASRRRIEVQRAIQERRPSPSTNNQRTIEDIHRNDILNEVGQLLDARLVSLTLQSEFAVDLSGVLDARLQQIPNRRRNNQRNNNQEQAIQNRRGSEALYTRHLEQQVEHMQSQLNELRRMVSVSFELQLDLQRQVREGFAAVAPAPNRVIVDGKPCEFRPSNVGDCLLCADKTVDTVFNKCGHMCCCNLCALQLKEKNDHCPVCRAPIIDVIRSYVSVLA